MFNQEMIAIGLLLFVLSFLIFIALPLSAFSYYFPREAEVVYLKIKNKLRRIIGMNELTMEEYIEERKDEEIDMYILELGIAEYEKEKGMYEKLL